MTGLASPTSSTPLATGPMRDRYPELEPFEHGMLDVGDGQLVYWETCGNPNGKPAVVLHGGPGSGCSPSYRRWFDPDAYMVVLFDQRGSGRSLPHASDPATDLSTNTTHHLIADIERLRQHLGIARWLVWGASWGSTLALAYAETHPEAVTEMVLVSVTMTRPADVHWLYHEVGRFLPEEWERFRAGVPPDDRDGDLDCSRIRTPPFWRRPPATGACGRTPSLPWSRAASTILATTTRGSGWRSPGS